VTWDEIRNTFYSRVSRSQILHTYVQSKPVNDVVYGQVVFDKTSLANKMLKEGPIKVRFLLLCNQCCGSGMFIPDPVFIHPGSNNSIKRGGGKN
jgi:hypothetical protein